ncbi:cytochrome P450 2C8-like [Discoglossus pictus]
MDLPSGAGLVLIMAIIRSLTISWWKKSLQCHSMLPPGPPRLPLIGNLHQVKPSAFFKSLLKLSEQYGSVYTLYFGSSPIVMLCGYDAVKEALIDHGDSFIGRGKMPLADYVMKGYGILASNGERWKQLRRFSLTTLRNFGMGKRSTEERIQEEAHYLVKKFRETQVHEFLLGIGKMQKEIDRVIGRQRCPSMDDRNQMPYTDAVIHEIQRHSDIIPTGIPHATIQDVSFRGYLIPKGSDVYPLLTTVLQDPGQFSTPEEFWPERFLDEQGKLKKTSTFMPFSTGKRMCPGEGLAHQELFIFLISIL